MSEFKAGKKISILTLDDARPFVGMRARLEYEGRLRGEGPISVTDSYVKTRPDGEIGSHDSGAIVPGRACTLTLLGTETENLRAMLDASNKAAAKLAVRLLEAEEREAREAKEKARAEALAEESARFPLPEGWGWGKHTHGVHTTIAAQCCGVSVFVVGDTGTLRMHREDHPWLKDIGAHVPLTAVRAVIARYDAENPPKVEEPAGYDLDVKGLPSRDIVDRFPEILDGDVVRLTLTDGRYFIRKLKVGPKRYDTTVSYRDIMGDHSTLVSGGSGFGVSKITFLRRDAAATAPKVEGYDIATAGRCTWDLAKQCPEILDGDIVMLTLYDGSSVERTVQRLTQHGGVLRTSVGYPNADGRNDRWLSGERLYGVRRITLVRRAEEPYSVQLDGRALSNFPHEFKVGDRVKVTHEDGRETEHKVRCVDPVRDVGIEPWIEGTRHDWGYINFVGCEITKITRLEASA